MLLTNCSLAAMTPGSALLSDAAIDVRDGLIHWAGLEGRQSAAVLVASAALYAPGSFGILGIEGIKAASLIKPATITASAPMAGPVAA